MKHLLYIGHGFHSLTKSTVFLQEMLKEHFEVEYCTMDPQDPASYANLAAVRRKYYDVVVIFQVMPSIREMRKHILFGHGVFFPMYDYYVGGVTVQNPLWAEYSEFTVINFSKTVHDELTSLGFCSKYIQYFPKPAEKLEYGDEKSVFSWQRIARINPHTVAALLKNFDYDSIHFHKAYDPKEKRIEPEQSMFPGKKMTTSVWYETREQMTEDLKKSAVYIAPRHLEGIGMSFLEAMALGRCVIAADNPTMNEYIVNGKTGLLYELCDTPDPLPRPADIRAIQKAAYDYICDGYARWEKNRYDICKWINGKCRPDHAKLEQTARVKGWGALPTPPRISFRYLLQRFLPNRLWNIAAKYFGYNIPWQRIEKMYLFGFIYLGCTKYYNNKQLRRIEFLGWPVYEKNKEKFGWN